MARAALNHSGPGLRRNTITNIEIGRFVGNRDSIGLIESVFRKSDAEFFP